MAINTLATATLFMTTLDRVAVQEATTGWMDANAGQVIYNGGSEVTTDIHRALLLWITKLKR